MLASGHLPAPFLDGLLHTVWPGRADVVKDVEPGLTFFLDGAHTGESAASCAEWFADATAAHSEPHDNVFLFNCLKEREPKRLLAPFVRVFAGRGVALSHALFVPVDAVETGAKGVVDLVWQESLKHQWKELTSPPRQIGDLNGTRINRPCAAIVLPSTTSALDWLRRTTRETRPRGVHVLVTGSLYLVGDILSKLKKLGCDGL